MSPDTSLSDVVRDTPATPAAEMSARILGEKALADSQAATENLARSYERTAERQRKDLADTRALSATQTAERTAARPEEPDLKPPPSTEARAFLQPGPGMLSQLQNALIGVGQLASGIAGIAKGGGYAIAATAALKGALEGWQQGDADRVHRSMLEWEKNHTNLLDQFKLRNERFRDILLDHRMTMQDRMDELTMQGEIDKNQQLAQVARLGQFDKLVNWYQFQEQIASQNALARARLMQDYGKWRATYDATQQQRAIQNARAAESLQLRRDLAAPAQKWQQSLVSNQQVLDDLNTMEVMVGRLNKAGLLQRTPAAWESVRASIAQKVADDPELKEAMDWMQRLGTARVAAAEIAAGEPAGTMRLRAVAEPQVAHILSVGPKFWADFFARTRTGIVRQNEMARKNLQAVNPAALGRAPAGDADLGDE